MKNWVELDRIAFLDQKASIDAALHGSTGMITGIYPGRIEPIFYMLMFCLCVPQSKAVSTSVAIDDLKIQGYFRRKLDKRQVKRILHGRVRFPSNKAGFICSAKRTFSLEIWPRLVAGSLEFEQTHSLSSLKSLRLWLVDNVHGMGFKAASHFLRNIGLSGLAILDVHILHCLHQRNLIEQNKKTLTKSAYSDIEETMLAYADRVGITIDQLDLLFWSSRTGFVFK